MTHKELFFKFLSGEPIDKVLFFPDITDWYKARRTPKGEMQAFPTGGFIPDDHPFHKINVDMPPEYADFTLVDFYRHFDWGLPVHIYYCYDYDYHEGWYDIEYEGVDREVETSESKYVIRLKCALGTLEKVDLLAADGSLCPHSYFVKSVEDLKIMEYIIAHTKIIPRYDRVEKVLKGIGELGIADIIIGRSPFGKLIHEYMGFENVAYALVDNPEAIKSFLTFQRAYDLEGVRMAANSPAKIVNMSDHADEHLISPRYYEEYCVPFYQETCRILHENGKIVSSHLDGNIKNLLPLLPKTGFDLLDGCSPAPMSNYEPEDLKRGLGDGMYAYCGVPATLFSMNLDDSKILEYGSRIVNALKGRLILNIGDVLPPGGDLSQLVKLGEWARGQ